MNNKKSYRKSLGLFEIVNLGLGGTIGSGIFVVPGIAAGIAGPSSLITWPIVAFSASCVAFSLAKTTLKYPSTGAFYSIFSKVFGKKTSSSLVMLYMISSVFGIATIAAGIGQYLSFFGFQNVLIIEVLIIIGFALLNIRGMYLSGKTENMLVVAKTLPLIVLAVLLIPYIQEKHFIPFSSTGTDFLRALVIVYWPFTGFEISAIPAEEAKDKRTIFRSLKIVMVVVVLIYVVLNLSLIGSLGSKVLANSPAPIATAAGLILKGSENVVALIGIIAMLSALNAYLVGTSRVMQNISHKFGLRSLKELSNRGTPTTAIVLSAFVTCILLFFSNRFQELASISVVTTLIPYVFVCLSAYKIFHDVKTRLVAGTGIIMTVAILTAYFIFTI